MTRNGSPAQLYQSPGVARLRDLLARGELIVCPGVYDGISARIALSKKPTALYCTGAGMTASRLGLPDLAFASQDDFVAQAGMIASLDRSTPVISDADTGFGSANQVARTVQRYAAAGIAALHIEDQVQSKRCGHLLGKELVGVEDYAQRIRAAAIGRVQSGQDIVILARSDAFQSFGLDETIKRLKVAVEAGADVAFFEGATTKEDVVAVVDALKPAPVMLNLVTGGVTPHWTAAECKEMGVKFTIYPGSALWAVDAALSACYGELVSKQASPDLVGSPKSFFQVMGLDACMALDKASGGLALAAI